MTSKNEELATVTIGSGHRHPGFTIPAPPNDPDYHQRSAGLVGDHRPLADRQADEAQKGGA